MAMHSDATTSPLDVSVNFTYKGQLRPVKPEIEYSGSGYIRVESYFGFRLNTPLILMLIWTLKVFEIVQKQGV